MKKQYEKPLIAVENYMLTQAIASCGTKISATNSQCVIDDPDAPDGFRNLASAFGYFSAGCLTQPSMDSVEDNICYHTSANAMFSSGT